MTTCGRWVGLLVCGVLAGVVSARGDVLIDFGTSVAEVNSGTTNPFGGGGPTPSPTGGNTWNNFTVGTASGSLIGLLNTDGSASGIDISVSGSAGARAWNQGRTPDANLNGGVFAFTSVTDDGIFSSGATPCVVTLSNLNVLLKYDLVLYGSRFNTVDANRWTTYSVTDGTPTGSSSGTLITGGSAIGGWNSNTVVTISGIAPSVSGTIAFQFTASNVSAGGTGNTFGPLNALELAVVPEPGSTAMGLLGAALVGIARRRQLSRG